MSVFFDIFQVPNNGEWIDFYTPNGVVAGAETSIQNGGSSHILITHAVAKPADAFVGGVEVIPGTDKQFIVTPDTLNLGFVRINPNKSKLGESYIKINTTVKI